VTKKKTPEVKDEGTRPRGFASPESQAKVKSARSIVAERYPSMTKFDSTKDVSLDDVTRYLIEVGAGRVMALANFESANGKEARQLAKPKKDAHNRAAKKGAKK
jgi:hypothetical protein